MRTKGRKDREGMPPGAQASIEHPEGGEDDEAQAVQQKQGSSISAQAKASVQMDKIKYELPEACRYDLLAKSLVSSLDHNYIMVHHPYPML